MSHQPYYQEDINSLVKSFDTNIRQGLSSQEAKRRLDQYGPNELDSTDKTTLLEKFINQFKDFMIAILVIAAAISFFMGHQQGEGPADAIIILLVVILNAIMGVFQESKAEEAIDALKEMASPEAHVLRDGGLQAVKSIDLVPGDIVSLAAGDIVPADLRLIEVNSLQIEEAALTGESVPVEKDLTIHDQDLGIGDQSNMAFSSTNVTYGRGVGIVVKTAMETEVGQIAQLLASTEKEMTPLQRDQDKLGKTLTIAIIVVAILTFIVGYFFRGFPWDTMLLVSISLAVAAIPEGLPAISTIILSLGTQRMAKRNALVRTLPAVETLGSTQVICSDKTGTLTINQMTVEALYYDGSMHAATDEIARDNPLLQTVLLANDTSVNPEGELSGDPTEIAFVKYAVDHNINLKKILQAKPRIDEIPFDSTRKLMSTIHQLNDGRYFIAVKGAPDQLLARSTQMEKQGKVTKLDGPAREEIEGANRTLAQKALRVLAGAYRIVDSLPQELGAESIEKDLIFVGLMGLIDPERPEAKASIEKARQAGLRTVMITGDHALTAQAIAERLGILEAGADNRAHVMTGEELDQLSDEALIQNIDQYSVYARVSPAHKVRIVKAWQANDKVVAMTGDGVNDAPSLKQANIGLGMGITGTEVSKGASDMILADDNFETIVVAVEEGRKVFANIQKAVQFLLSANLGEVLTLFIATLCGWTILEPVHILWINLVTDVFPAIALGMEAGEANAMRRQPREKDSNFLSFGILPSIFYQGILEGGITLFVYWYARFQLGVEVNLAETMAFITLGAIQLFHVYNMKSIFQSLFSRNPFDNKYLNLAFIVSGAMLLAVILVPGINQYFDVTVPNLQQWMISLGAAVSIIPIVEIAKWIFRLSGKADTYEQIIKD